MNTEPVTFSVADGVRRPASPIHAVIKDAELPMAWWRAVAVRRWTEKSLSNLEQFVLEAALTTGGIDTVELATITGLPGGILPALVRRLVAVGVMHDTGNGYAVDPSRAREALNARHLRVEEIGRTDLIFLPETDEMLAIDARASGDPLSQLDNRKLDPAYQIPVDQELAGTERSTFIGQRIRQRRIAGLPTRVLDAVAPEQEESLLANGFCPVYRCEAIVRQNGDRLAVELTIYGQSVRKRRGQDSQQRRVTLHLTGADRLAANWAQTGDLLIDPDMRLSAWAAITADQPATPAPIATRLEPLTWQWHLVEKSVNALCQAHVDLSRPIVLQARLKTFSAHLATEFVPADPVAKARIGVDRAINAAEQADCDPAALQRELAGLAPQLPTDVVAHLASDAVLDRAWQLGRYQLAYALRQAEDFSYA